MFVLYFPAAPVTNGSEKQESPRPASYVSNKMIYNPNWCWRHPLSYEPRHKKTCLWDLRPGKVQTSLLRLALAWHFSTYWLQVLYYLRSEQQRCWSDCVDAQADLHLFCLHRAKAGFLMTKLIFWCTIWLVGEKLEFWVGNQVQILLEVECFLAPWRYIYVYPITCNLSPGTEGIKFPVETQKKKQLLPDAVIIVAQWINNRYKGSVLASFNSYSNRLVCFKS